MMTAFCSIQVYLQRQRQIVHAHAEQVGQGQGDLHRDDRVVALAEVDQAGDAVDRAEVEVVEAELAARQRQHHGVLRQLLHELAVVAGDLQRRVAAADQEEVLDLAARAPAP